jgi:hypothetical protein
MNASVRRLLESFNRLDESDKKECAVEIFRRTVDSDYGPLTDLDLTQIADRLFLALDEEEDRS